MRKSLVLLSLSLLLQPAFSAHAATPPVAAPRVFSNEDGDVSLKVWPAKTGPASAGWIAMNESGDETVAKTFPLLDNPARVLVAPRELGYFATLNDSDHAVVIYNADGTVVRDLRLTDVLTLQEIKDHASQTPDSPNWWRKASFKFDTPILATPSNPGLHLHVGIVVFPRLHITFPWGKEVFVRLRDGVVSTG